jgi:hypothetical protein
MEFANLFQSDWHIHPGIQVEPMPLESIATTCAAAIQADVVKLLGEVLPADSGY